MSERTKTSDRRLLAALDYIDQKYIDDVFDLIKEPQAVSEPTAARRTPFKHWKQFVALAACLILLSMASPIVNYVVEAVRSFAAGWGSESLSEEQPETTSGMYDEYILTEEDLAQINEAYLLSRIDELDDVSEEDIERLRNSKYHKFAQTVEEAMIRDKGGRFYFGKFGECFIFDRGPNERNDWNFVCDIGKYKISGNGYIMVAYKHEWMRLGEAYERGLLSDEDVEKLYEVYCKYYKGSENNGETLTE